jgi:hypothetical protein
MVAGGRGSGDAVCNGGDIQVGILGVCLLDTRGPEYPTKSGRWVLPFAGGLGS